MMELRYLVVRNGEVLTRTCSYEVADDIANREGGEIIATMPVGLAILADSSPNYRLAVVVKRPSFYSWVADPDTTGGRAQISHHRVVKMEGEDVQ